MLKDENGVAAVEQLLRPEALPEGGEPEQRLIFCGISWERYLAFDQTLGDDRPAPRLYFLDGPGTHDDFERARTNQETDW